MKKFWKSMFSFGEKSCGGNDGKAINLAGKTLRGINESDVYWDVEAYI